MLAILVGLSYADVDCTLQVTGGAEYVALGGTGGIAQKAQDLAECQHITVNLEGQGDTLYGFNLSAHLDMHIADARLEEPHIIGTRGLVQFNNVLFVNQVNIRQSSGITINNSSIIGGALNIHQSSNITISNSNIVNAPTGISINVSEPTGNITLAQLNIDSIMVVSRLPATADRWVNIDSTVFCGTKECPGAVAAIQNTQSNVKVSSCTYNNSKYIQMTLGGPIVNVTAGLTPMEPGTVVGPATTSTLDPPPATPKNNGWILYVVVGTAIVAVVATLFRSPRQSRTLSSPTYSVAIAF